jgi:hypothetical protein
VSRAPYYYPTQVPKLGPKRRKFRSMRAARGIPALVDRADAQARTEWLYGIGFSDFAIGAAAGLPPTTVRLVRLGANATVGIDHAARLMTVSHMPIEAQARTLVPAFGVRRRIHALWALGHTSAVISTHMEKSLDWVFDACSGHRLRGSTWLRMRDVYEELSAVPGDSREGRRRALARGLSAPLDWQGLDIDHPDHEPLEVADSGLPDEVAVHRILRGLHTGEIGTPERKAVVRHAAVSGWPAQRLADALRISHVAAEAALVRRRRQLREEGAA